MELRRRHLRWAGHPAELGELRHCRRQALQKTEFRVERGWSRWVLSAEKA
jgi:hypothetical protein